MSEGTIFFSYSRDNSEFVINLANDLRAAGANVWMDQIDIKPGTRWDRSIEKALVSSQTLLVILSKSSVESNNVMDEVSFALEEGKHIVPVLFEECTIPFRLRRLQFADFTGDHEKGIKTLIAALNLEQQIASKLITGEATEPKKEVKKEKPVAASKRAEEIIAEPAKEVSKHTTIPVQKTKKKSKTALFAIFGIAIIAIAFAAFKFMGPSEDEKHWEKALVSNTLEDFDYHVQNFDECTHKELATKKIALIVQNDKDNIDWKKIQNSRDFIDFEKHIENFPNCSHTKLANTKIAALANEIKDKNAWDKVLQEKSEASINSYLKEFPSGIHVNQAKSLVTAFTKEKEEWNAAVKTNSVSAYTNFLKKYPESKFSADANSKLNVINAASTRNRDIKDWNRIYYSKSIYDFGMHLRSFKNCIHKTNANNKIAAINNQNRSNAINSKKDVADWNRINGINNTTKYLIYHLKNHPTCIHKVAANNKITAIDSELRMYRNAASRPTALGYFNYINQYGNKGIYYISAKRALYSLSKNKSVGWIYVGNLSNDKRYISSSRNYNNFKNTNPSKLPVAGDLVQSAANKQFFYTAPNGGNKTTKPISYLQVFVVLEVHKKLINNDSQNIEIWLRVAKI